MSAEPRPGGRIEVLDELKGVAILLVVLYHAGGVLVWEDRLHGEAGVDMFVILSGLGLALGDSGRAQAGAFLWRRFLRIYPAYWIALTLILVLNRVFLHASTPWPDIAWHYTGLHAWIGPVYAMSINDSFWFITLIVTLYVVYLPLRRLAEHPDQMLLAGAAISAVAATVFLKMNQAVAFGFLGLRIPGFFLGLVAGRWIRERRIHLPLTWALGAAAVLIFYVPYVFGFIFANVWVGVALLVFYAWAVRPQILPSVQRDLKFLGDRSLEIFLLHQPFIRNYNLSLLERLHPMPGNVQPPALLIAAMVIWFGISVVVADGLHRLLNLLGRRRPPPAPVLAPA